MSTIVSFSNNGCLTNRKGRLHPSHHIVMHRCEANGREVFQEITEEHTKELEAAVCQRRKDLNQEWDEVETGWAKLQGRMRKVGMRPAATKDNMIRLNVGGWYAALSRSTLTAASESGEKTVLGALFEGEWDKRFPRDGKGRLVLDESPTCFKHIMQALLLKTQQTAGFEGVSPVLLTSTESVEDEDEPYISRARVWYGLAAQYVPGVNGGSSILRHIEIKRFLGMLRTWCPNEARGLKLLYRASRDGFSASSFHAKCDDCSSTLTLVKVDAGEGRQSVIGGYADISWGRPLSAVDASDSQYARSSNAFIFSLKNGMTGSYTNGSTPGALADAERWAVQAPDTAIVCGTSSGPWFGEQNLRVHFDGPNLMTGYPHYCGSSYAVGDSLHYLHQKNLVEIEVFCFEEPIMRESSMSSASASGQSRCEHEVPRPMVDSNDVETKDLHSFGSTIADSFMLERRAIVGAKAELKQAVEKVEAAVQALRTVYGPAVAAGKEDTVVELSVRGTVITTLLSTLQACPDSALATRFNEERWPANGNDADERGRRLVDCDPICFSKVLDVLRLRKRAAWARVDESDKMAILEEASGAPLVTVKACDREAFDTLVNMYFPGCESFVTDLIEPPGTAGDTS